MKKPLLLLFSILILPLSVNATDIYYCSDDDTIGFDVNNNNYKIITNFDTKKFKILIDFENYNVVSDNMFMGGVTNQRCLFDNVDKTLYCINNYGRGFSINKNSLRYARSTIFIEEIYKTDDYILAYGTCEKF